MIPIHFFLFGCQPSLSLGWHAWPVAPDVGDTVVLTAMQPGRVVARQWAMEVVAKAPAMVTAGLWRPYNEEQLVCSVFVDVPDQPAYCVECGAAIPRTNATVNDSHAVSCSLHPANIYDRPRGES